MCEYPYISDYLNTQTFIYLNIHVYTYAHTYKYKYPNMCVVGEGNIEVYRYVNIQIVNVPDLRTSNHMFLISAPNIPEHHTKSSRSSHQMFTILAPNKY